MSGNVWEWCNDHYEATYYEKCKLNGLTTNPTGPDSGIDRVLRGGSWRNRTNFSRVTCRNGYDPSKKWRSGGFRLVLA